MTEAEECLRAAENLSHNEAMDPTQTPATQRQCDEIRKFIIMSSSRLAPIRRLIPEILSLVFSHWIPDSHLAIGRPGLHEHPLARVSFHWRAIAFATPSLWSKFSISLRGDDRALQMLNLYLRRSLVSPLTIEVRKDVDLQLPFHSGIVDRLIENSERWQRITFPLDYQLLSLFSPVRGRLPSLEVASFSSAKKASEPSELESIVAFEIAPKLRSLSLRNARNDLPPFPLNQLERVLFTNLAEEVIIPVITKSPNLRSLTCRWIGTVLPTHPPPPPYLFSSLTTIALKADFHLLRCLTAPNLESLSLTDLQHFAISMVVPIVERSQCNLRYFLLDKVWVNGTSLVEILGAMPTLNHLTIVDGRPNSLTEMAMEALIIDPGRAAVLPALQTLTLKGSYLFRTSTLLDMLESRITNVATHDVTQLQLVDLRLDHRQFTEADLERFHRLKEVAVGLSLQRMDAQKICVNIL
ncbi:hypothetical protein B0H13DRAFT_2515333 [Mycena leptocephala]|nr:hypothetical protein B0H13DRAFT_2515333 [Mycena leptocephala]